MNSGGYKNFLIYLNGIKFLDKMASDNDAEVRMFIDITIYNDKKIMSYINSFKNITAILFKCSNFLTDGHHVEVFGTLVRFFPLFNFPNNDAECVFISDVDMKEEYKGGIFYLYENIKKKNVYCFFNGRYFNIHVSVNKMTSASMYEELYLPYCIAPKIIGIKQIPIKPFISFLKEIKIYMNDSTRPTKILSDYYISEQKLITKCEKNICFGIDEYFLNKILFKYLAENKIPFCYKTSYNLAQFYYFKHPKNVFTEHNLNMSRKEYEKIFYGYMKNIGLDKYSYEEMDEKIFGKNSNSRNFSKISVATKFMTMYAKKIIPLLQKLYKENDFRIYTKSQINSMLSVEFTKYYYITYIRFFYTNDKDLIISKMSYPENL